MSTKSLGDKHAPFVPLIAAIDRMEDEIETGRPVLVRAEAGVLHETLAHELLPHAVGEGRTLFPVLRRITGSDEVTNDMLHDHREIARLTDELDRLRHELIKAGIGSDQQERMRVLLDDLRSTVGRHFEQEERSCFEVLKQELSPQEAEGLCEALETATHAVRRTIECGGGPSYSAE